MRVLWLIAFSILLPEGVMAQSTPAPQTPIQTIKNIVFKEAERRIIEDYLGVKTAKTQSSKESEAEEEDEEEEKGKGKGKKKNKGKDHKKNKKAKKHKKRLPPGLAKRRELPPGLAKRETLPPGLDRTEIPKKLATKLPPAQEGTERVVVDNNIVLLEQGTNLVLDVIEGVITGSGN